MYSAEEDACHTNTEAMQQAVSEPAYHILRESLLHGTYSREQAVPP